MHEFLGFISTYHQFCYHGRIPLSLTAEGVSMIPTFFVDNQFFLSINPFNCYSFITICTNSSFWFPQPNSLLSKSHFGSILKKIYFKKFIGNFTNVTHFPFIWRNLSLNYSFTFSCSLMSMLMLMSRDFVGQRSIAIQRKPTKLNLRCYHISLNTMVLKGSVFQFLQCGIEANA